MSITQYSRYRRLKLRAAWQLAGMAVWCKEVGTYLVAFIAALVLVTMVTDMSIAADEADEKRLEAQAKAERHEYAWLSCLNHKGVWIDGRLHTCTVADTFFTRESFRE